jgi:tripartite-type tricarboxylate transporter receptor subunit TctC
MKLPRRQFLHLTAGAAALPVVPRIAWAQAYPTRPVRFIVPVVAGGSTDTVARLVGEHLSRAFGQQFIVDNRSTAGGTAGMEAVAKSAPDGYTLLVTTDRVASAPHAFKLNFDPLKNFAAIDQLTRQPLVLAVHHSLGIDSLGELVARAKTEPGMNYATSGVGIHQHVVGEWFQKLAGIKLIVVPYRGAGQAINDLIAGHVKIGVLGSTPLIPHYKAGTLRLLAQSSAARSTGLSDVPTFQEAGLKGLVLDQWIGVFAPVGIPQAIVARLNAEMNKVLAMPSVRENLEQQALEPVGGSVEHARQLFEDDFEKYGKLMKELSISAN